MTDQERAAAFIGATEMVAGHESSEVAHALAFLFEAVRREERQRLVAYLRNVAAEWNTHHRTPQGVVLDASADRIERGEHAGEPL